jgi:acetyltransferase-like isoleucine patch superfamily enzyme
VLFLGQGAVVMGRDVEFGWPRSKAFYTGYCHLEAARPESVIEIGDEVQINNNAFIKSDGPGIRIGARALLGSEVTIYDSDFHDLHPDRRRGGHPRMGSVELGEDVFVGDGVKILKGVSIGARSVIGAGSVVAASIPEGVIAAGNPARVMRPLEEGAIGPMGVMRPLEEGVIGPMGVMRPLEDGVIGPMGVMRPPEDGVIGPMGVMRPPEEGAIGPMGEDATIERPSQASSQGQPEMAHIDYGRRTTEQSLQDPREGQSEAVRTCVSGQGN